MFIGLEKYLITISSLLAYTLSCEHPFVSNGNYCVYLTEPRTFENGCDVNHFDNFDEELYKTWNTMVWLPVSSRYRYGPLVFQKPGKEYAEKYSVSSYFDNMDEFSSTGDCFIVGNDIGRYVNCNEKHPHVCAYLKKKTYYQYCYNHNYTTTEACICKFINSESDEENDRCELKTDVSEEDDEIIQVPDPTELSVCYYRSSNFFTSSCKVKAQDVPRTDLVLKFDIKTRKLFLSVYSPEGIFKYNSPSIYCFTDATEKIETQVELDFILATFSNTSRNRQIYELELKDYIGNYWCEAFQLPDLAMVKSNKVLAFKRQASEFALKLSYENFHFRCIRNPLEILYNRILVVLKVIFNSKVKKIRLMEIVDVTKGYCRIVFIIHITQRNNNNSFFNYKEFEEAYTIHDTDGKIYFEYVANALYCESENNGTLNWPRAYIGDSVTSLEICIDSNGVPVRRLCGGNFTYGSRWLEENSFCSQDIEIPARTLKLHNITLQNMGQNLAKDVVKLSSEVASSLALDIEYFSEALNKMSKLTQNSSDYVFDIIEIVDNIMETDYNTLKQSQLLFNATDNILHVSETVYENSELLENITFLQLQKNNYLVQVSKPFQNNISGIALYGNNTSNIKIVALNFTEEIPPPFTDDLILAMHIKNDSFYTCSNNLTIIITVYFQDKLFVNSQVIGSKIISVVVPEYSTYLRKPVKVWFRSDNSNGNCSFWDYGDTFQRKTGSWSDTGGAYVRSIPNNSVVECEYSHLTPFALLVLTEKNTVDNITYDAIFTSSTVSHYDYLNLITIIGTVLSVTGISVIFCSAILFKQWRVMVGTKILLQLSSVILLEIILTQIADMHNVKNSTACTALGIFLHYIVCSKFCWMLVFAILQYSRFVLVLAPRSNHLVFKVILVGWILPLFPVIIVVCVSLESYSAGSFMFCYPKGLALLLGLLMPISIIIIINVFVFIFIMYNISKVKQYKQDQKQRQIILAVLLFFVLGLPWLFGIFIEIFDGSWFHYFCAYMFCITATLQGFILFIFYILLNRELRSKWVHLLCSRGEFIRSSLK